MHLMLQTFVVLANNIQSFISFWKFFIVSTMYDITYIYIYIYMY